MFDYPILSLLIWTPIIIGIFLVLSQDISDTFSELIFSISTFFIFILVLILTHNFNITNSNLQFVEKSLWIDGFDIYCFLGVDGISIS